MNTRFPWTSSVSSLAGKSLGRRQVLKASAKLAAGAAVIAAPLPLRHARGEVVEINWLSYPGHAVEEVIGPFEKANNVKVNSVEFTSGERMLALINSSPPGTFDMVMDDAAYIEWLYHADMLEVLDPKDYPLQDFYPEFQKWSQVWDGDTMFAVPTTWGYNGIAYNSEVLTAKDVDSYSIMWEDRLKGKLGMRDWYLPSMGCISAYLGNRLPYDITNEQFEQLKTTMNTLSGSVIGFWGFGGVFDSLAGGSAILVPGCGDWMTGLLQRDKKPIKSLAPKEGAVNWFEVNAIIKGTEKKDLCVALIKYLSSPEGQIRTCFKSSYLAASVSAPAWEQANKERIEDARLSSMDLNEYNIMEMLRDGRILTRTLPKQQPLEVWQEAYTAFQNL